MPRLNLGYFTYMRKFSNIILKGLLAVTLLIAVPSLAQSAPTSFLPMEDALSAARNNSGAQFNKIKPYRQSFNLGSQRLQKTSYINFTTTDICAFILLAGIYVMFVRRNSKSRNASF